MLDGLMAALTPGYLVYMCIGVLAGIVVGALPGFTATMGTALMLPFTFALPPGQGFAMLAALYVAAMFADSVPACLVNTPGTPSAVATALDGYPMTKQGRGQAALIASCFSALVGTLIGGLAFLLLSQPLAEVALTFGPPEFFWIGVFALTIIGSIAGDSLLKGIAGGCLGMLIGAVGISATGAVPRYTFGTPELLGGISIVAALIGIFAIPQVIQMVRDRRADPYVAEFTRRRGVTWQTIRDILSRPVNLLRSSLIGTAIGILPGAGSPVASLVSYNEAVRWSKDKASFGRGNVDGVVASESSGNSAAGGAMVPLVALGIPGSAPAAVIYGALLLQGLRPGPELFASDASLVYSFAWSVMLAGVVTFVLGMVLAGGLARMVMIPVRLLAPVILFLSVIGSYAIRSSVMDVFLMLGLGVGIYFLSLLGFHPGPIGLGVILGPIVEPALVQSLSIAKSSSVAAVFFGRPISIVLIVLTVFSAGWVVFSQVKDARDRRGTGRSAATTEAAEPAPDSDESPSADRVGR
ncbi:MAG: tripartite tricarboxylate transporter permease [Nocardioidaceae bacterium]